MIESAKQDISVILIRKHKEFKDSARLGSFVNEIISLPLCDKTLQDRILRYVGLIVACRSFFYCLFYSTAEYSSSGRAFLSNVCRFETAQV